jgi:hypothetical protein
MPSMTASPSSQSSLTSCPPALSWCAAASCIGGAVLCCAVLSVRKMVRGWCCCAAGVGPPVGFASAELPG